MFSDLFRPVLSDKTIMKYNKKGILIENPIQPVQLQPNSVDLTLSNSYKVLRTNEMINGRRLINPQREIRYKSGTFNIGNPGTKLAGMEYFILNPNQFCLLSSNEVLNIPNGILSFVQGRSSIARLGIQTEQAGLIDAGFKGTITFEIFNQTSSPIILYSGMRIAQVYFFKAQYADKIYGSLASNNKYNSQSGATGSKINQDFVH